jgi:signal transduction histidine kinase
MGNYRRRTKLLLEPALQLKLPLTLLIVTLLFATFQIAHSYYAFGQIFDDVFREAGKPEFLEDVIREQSSTFIEVSAEVALAYLLVVAVLSATYVHRMIGPIVAFRRHIEALKNGDYQSRVRLRKGDAFSVMLTDLNELAELLERDEKKQEPQ